ncbi:SOS response-associated peptidase [Argonema galeatum]|uniref:SOS response-associated peptidase n=1 Tax=Argonema galeatum TaxID=2942762 RepID=UPI00201114B7|nr:SOS response-associated peptidase [Argonema galeatum]MCL1465764.1 SOS response-associated peptidase [Argonema galeatum A003/A1]
MCGRFSFTQSEKIVAEVFQLASVPTLSPRYNIAPTQPVPTVLVDSDDKNRHLKMLRWGLIPSWAKDIKIGAKLINARAETVAEKPAFRSAFKRRRCLILADGFYEWQEQEGKKQPFYFRLQDGKPFAFAGLWERWEKGEDEAIASCTILTTESNELMGPIHDRMPVILDPKDYDKWLDPEVQKPESLQSLLQPYKSEEMTFYPVTTKVNNAKTDSPDCIKKV